MEFGDFLRMKRNEKGMTIRQLALYAECSDSYLSQLERGERGARGPTPHFLRKLAAPLGIPYEVIMAAAGYHLLTKEDDLYSGAIITWLRESIGDAVEPFADRVGMSAEEILTMERHGVASGTLQLLFDKIFRRQRSLTLEQKVLLRQLEDAIRQFPPDVYLKMERLLKAALDMAL